MAGDINDYLMEKIGCYVSSPYKHVDVVGEIKEWAIYNFLISDGQRTCIANKNAVWRLSCRNASKAPNKGRPLYSLIKKGTHVTVYLFNGKISGQLRHVGNFEVVVGVGDEEYYIHKDQIVAICWGQT